MKPGIRITQDCADPCRGMSTQEPVESKKCVEAWPRPAIRVVGGGPLCQAISSRRRGELDLGDEVEENRPAWWTKNQNMGNGNRQMFVRPPPPGLCAIAALFYVRRFLETKRLTW